MKTLYIIRHAKSSWELDVIDHQRPLNTRGIADATLIGKQLKTIIPQVDKIISSDAKRTLTTANLIVQQLAIDDKTIHSEPKMYDFNGTDVLKVIRSCEDMVNSLLIFGHNSALTSLVNFLGSTSIDNLPTAGVVAITFEQAHWKDVQKGTTQFTIFPKEVR